MASGSHFILARISVTAARIAWAKASASSKLTSPLVTAVPKFTVPRSRPRSITTLWLATLDVS